jgi:hypothetical protein
VSFSGGILQPDDVRYPYNLCNELNLKLTKDDVTKIFGAPFESLNSVERYNMTDEIIMSICYDNQSWEIILITFGIHAHFYS